MHEYLLKSLSSFSSYFQIHIPDMADRLDVDRCHWCCLLVSVILSGYKLRIHVESATCVTSDVIKPAHNISNATSEVALYRDDSCSIRKAQQLLIEDALYYLIIT